MNRVLRIAIEPVCMVGVAFACVVVIVASLPWLVYVWLRDKKSQ